MNGLTIDCPRCGDPFELTEARVRPMLEAERRRVTKEAEQRFRLEAQGLTKKAVEKAHAESEALITELKRQKEAGEVEVEKARQAELAALKAQQQAEESMRAIEVEIARRVAEQAAATADQVRQEMANLYAAELEDVRSLAAAKDAKLAESQEVEIAARRAIREAEDAKRAIEVEIARRVNEQAITAADRAREEVANQYAAELDDVRSQVAEKDAKLAEAQEAEIAARRAVREAEDAKRETELLVERRLDEQRRQVREQALNERDDEYRLKLQEKERQLSDLKEKLAEAQRKADLGSQQLKGDVLEVDLFDTLSSAFLGDTFERVKKGQKGGDTIQTVRNSSGLVCGRIKWESKYTQNWNDTWLPKLREDQRAAKCDLAALMSDVLPDGVDYFDLIDGVWVSSIATVVPMAAALRRGLIETAMARRSAAGADSNKDQVYRYLTGPEFRARVQGVIEPVLQMRNSLESEKRSAARQFASRDKQLERVVMSLSGMYGDLQGLAGASLPTVPGLALPEPETSSPVDTTMLADGHDGADRQVQYS